MENAERSSARRGGRGFADESPDAGGHLVVAVVEGPDAIRVVRAMVGATRPADAAPGTIRGDFCITGMRNLIHASDAPETAKAEIDNFFSPTEVLSYSREVEKWILEENQ